MIFAFCVLSLSYTFPELNLYTFLNGNWTYNSKSPISIELRNETNNSDGTVYNGYFMDNEINIKVTSNSTCVASYLDHKISLDFKKSVEGVSYTDFVLSDGSHASIVIFNQFAFEITIVDKENQQFGVYGFKKDEKFEYTLKDFLIPTGIAIFIMVVGKKFLGKL